MRYILTLFLIALVSSSEIINKADEIQEFAEYDDVQLEFLFGLIPVIGKIVAAGIGLFAKAKTVFAGVKAVVAGVKAVVTGTKVFKFVKGAVTVGSKIFKGAKALIQNSKIFKFGKTIFEKGRAIYDKYKGIIQNTKLYRRVVNTIDKVKQSQIYQTYQKMKETYDKGKEIYDKATNYYNKGKDFYDKYIKRQNGNSQPQGPQQRTQQTTQKKPPTPTNSANMTERNKAYQRYGQIRTDKTMSLATKRVAITNHLNYMVSRGFINQEQKKQMSI